jgi:Zn-dependent M28 family amino/carboxypeptidase
MRRFLQSSARILAATTILLTILLSAFWLFAAQPLVSPGPRRSRESADPQRLRQHVEFLTGLEPTRAAKHPVVLDRAAEYLAARLAEAGATVRFQPYSANRRSYRNVLATLGAEHERFVVVGAHYDAFGEFVRNPGADDNASGTAGLVELVRVLAREPLPVRVEFVAYSTEEPPYFASEFMGSAIHAGSVEDRKPEAMICLEMIGYFTEVQPWPSGLLDLMYPDHGQFIGVIGRPRDRALVARIKSGLRARREIEVISYAGPSFDGLDASDHRNYWARGIHAVMISDTAFVRNPNYHTERDTAETLDYLRMGQVVNGLAEAILAWPVPANPES